MRLCESLEEIGGRATEEATKHNEYAVVNALMTGAIVTVAAERFVKGDRRVAALALSISVITGLNCFNAMNKGETSAALAADAAESSGFDRGIDFGT